MEKKVIVTDSGRESLTLKAIREKLLIVEETRTREPNPELRTQLDAQLYLNNQKDD